MTCALAPPASSSARTISAEWCAPVIPATATTASATAAERSRTAWVAALPSHIAPLLLSPWMWLTLPLLMHRRGRVRRQELECLHPHLRQLSGELQVWVWEGLLPGGRRENVHKGRERWELRLLSGGYLPQRTRLRVTCSWQPLMSSTCTPEQFRLGSIATPTSARRLAERSREKPPQAVVAVMEVDLRSRFGCQWSSQKLSVCSLLPPAFVLAEWKTAAQQGLTTLLYVLLLQNLVAGHLHPSIYCVQLTEQGPLDRKAGSRSGNPPSTALSPLASSRKCAIYNW